MNENSNVEYASVVLTNESMQRNIRCCLAYLNYRVQKIERLGWEAGKHLPEHIIDKMSAAELEYYRKYIENVEAYNQAITE